jgi:hypothetical protein
MMKVIKNIFLLLIIITSSYKSFAQNVGIGTLTPTYKLDVKGDVPFPLVSFQNSSTNAGNYGLFSFSTNGTGVLAQSTNGRALHAFNFSNTLPAVEIENGGVNGISLKTKGKNSFNGTSYGSVFNTGANEDVYIRGGKDNALAFINDIPGGKVAVGGVANSVSSINSTLSVFGSMRLPSKKVFGSYTATDADFTILVDVNNNAATLININLPTANAAIEGRLYIIKGINMPLITNYNAGGFIRVYGNFQEYGTYYQIQNSLIDIGAFNQRFIAESITIQCISNQWHVLSKYVYNSIY